MHWWGSIYHELLKEGEIFLTNFLDSLDPSEIRTEEVIIVCTMLVITVLAIVYYFTQQDIKHLDDKVSDTRSVCVVSKGESEGIQQRDQLPGQEPSNPTESSKVETQAKKSLTSSKDLPYNELVKKYKKLFQPIPPQGFNRETSVASLSSEEVIVDLNRSDHVETEPKLVVLYQAPPSEESYENGASKTISKDYIQEVTPGDKTVIQPQVDAVQLQPSPTVDNPVKRSSVVCALHKKTKQDKKKNKTLKAWTDKRREEEASVLSADSGSSEGSKGLQ